MLVASLETAHELLDCLGLVTLWLEVRRELESGRHIELPTFATKAVRRKCGASTPPHRGGSAGGFHLAVRAEGLN